MRTGRRTMPQAFIDAPFASALAAREAQPRKGPVLRAVKASEPITETTSGVMLLMSTRLAEAVERTMLAAGRPEDHAAFVEAMRQAGIYHRRPSIPCDLISYRSDPLWDPIGGTEL